MRRLTTLPGGPFPRPQTIKRLTKNADERLTIGIGRGRRGAAVSSLADSDRSKFARKLLIVARDRVGCASASGSLMPGTRQAAGPHQTEPPGPRRWRRRLADVESRASHPPSPPSPAGRQTAPKQSRQATGDGELPSSRRLDVEFRASRPPRSPPIAA